MEDDVNALVELSAVMGLCLEENRDETLAPTVRHGMVRLGDIMERHAASILSSWHRLDAATADGETAVHDGRRRP